MPRDSAGNYNLVAGNPVQSGEVISSSWANNTMDDVAVALTDSLDRNGRGGMLAPFRFADGTNLLPGASWVNETTTGFYRFDGGDLRIAVLTQDVMRWQTTGVQIWDSTDMQWDNVLTDGGGGSQVPVNVGTADGQTMRWAADNSAWEATSALVVTDAGNVGIGTPTPDALLEVSGGNDNEPLIRFQSAAGFGYTFSRSGGGNDAGYMRTTADQAGFSGWTWVAPEGERMRIDSSGNVGIGTTSSGGGNSYLGSSNTMLKVKGNAANKIGSLQLQSFGTANNSIFEVAALDASQGVAMGTMTNGPLSIQTNNSTRMTIDSAGNVGIGTTDPGTAKLRVWGDLRVGTNTGGSIGTINLNGEKDAISARNAQIQKMFESPFDFTITAAQSNTTPAAMIFKVRSDAEAMRIDSSGNLLVGTTTEAGATGNAYRFNGVKYNYAAAVYEPAATANVISFAFNAPNLRGFVDSTGVTIGVVSDRRLKTNIRPSVYGVESVLALNPVQFTGINMEGEECQEAVGLIAQEVRDVIPELVEGIETEDSYISLNYAVLTSVLVKAIQEQQEQIDELRALIGA